MLKPEQIKSHRFISNTKGAYEADDVDNFFAEVSEYYEQMFSENVDLVKKISFLAEKIKQYKEDEDNIRRALITAERTASQIRADAEAQTAEQLEKAEKTYNDMVLAAQNKASVLETSARVHADKLTEESEQAAQERITNAEKTASAMIANAEKKAHDIVEDAKRFAQQELDRINHEIEVNSVALSALEKEVTTFKQALIESYKKHIEYVAALPREDDFKVEPKPIAETLEENTLETEEDVVKAADQFISAEENKEEEKTEESAVESAEFTSILDMFVAEDANEPKEEEAVQEVPAANEEAPAEEAQEDVEEVSLDLEEIQDDMDDDDEDGDKPSIFKNLFNKK